MRENGDRDRDGEVAERESERERERPSQPGSFYILEQLIGLHVLNVVKCGFYKDAKHSL